MATTFTVPDGRVAMAATLYTGAGAGSPQSISNAVNAVSFQPGLVWVKARNANGNNAVTDSVRGAYLQLITQLTNVEANYSPYGVTSFNANGFGVNDDNSGNYSVNGAAGGLYSGTPPNYVAWSWKAGGTAVSNIVGTITSSVSANTDAGFSVVTYTGTGANATVGHGLGVAPSMVIVKRRNSTGNWPVQHTSVSASNVLFLDLTNAQTASTTFQQIYPTASIFYIDGGNANVGANGGTYVAYCWAPVAGYSAFGSYTGNGSADGPFIYTGFRPRWILLKNTSVGTAGYDWELVDTSRSTYNVVNAELVANLSNIESSSWNAVDILSNGFKLRDLGAAQNGSGNTMIYAAFAENPLKFSNAR